MKDTIGVPFSPQVRALIARENMTASASALAVKAQALVRAIRDDPNGERPFQAFQIDGIFLAAEAALAALEENRATALTFPVHRHEVGALVGQLRKAADDFREATPRISAHYADEAKSMANAVEQLLFGAKDKA